VIDATRPGEWLLVSPGTDLDTLAQELGLSEPDPADETV
jgi:hypothetical protein